MSIHFIARIGERVKAVRLARGLTQVQLSIKSGMSQGDISTLEAGETKWLRGGTLLALAKALEVNPHWLNDGSGDPARAIRGTTEHARVIELYDALLPVNRDNWIAIGDALLSRQPPPASPSTSRPYLVPKS